MCYYDQIRFTCGDWKWGHFRQHCRRDYRIGETCGMKLIMESVTVGQKCKLCEKSDRKMRRRAAEVDRINRWQKEGGNRQRAMEKSMEIIRKLDKEIHELHCERYRRRTGLQTPAAGVEHISNGEPSIQSSGISNTPRQGNLATRALDRPDIQSADNTPIRQSIDHHDRPPAATLLDEASREHRPQHSQKPIGYRLVSKQNIFLGLPITFESIPNPATVMGIPDTGADENMISLSLAIKLGLDLDMDMKNEEFLGTITKGVVRCCGLARAYCGFGTTSHLGPSGLLCTFRVSESTVSPLIMSYSFLMDTLTLSTHRHRLVSLARSALGLPCIRAFGHPRRRLMCSLDGQDIKAFPDTGSDIDVIAYDYAVERRLLMEPTNAEVMFADGSIKEAVGICTGQLAVGSGIGIIPANESHTAEANSSGRYDTERPPSDHRPTADTNTIIHPSTAEESNHHNVIYTQFYVLREITVEVLLGSSSLESLQVYTRHQDQFTAKPLDDIDTASLNRIILLGKIEQFLSQAVNKWFGKSQEFGFTTDSTNTISSLGRTGHDVAFEQILSEADQRENARREAAMAEAIRLTGEAKLRFEEQERKKQDGYNEYRAALQRVKLQGRWRITSHPGGL